MGKRKDAKLAAQLAGIAGKLALDLRDSGRFKGKKLGDAGDRIANQFLVGALGEMRPDDGLLSEEREDDRARLHKSRVWIVDPVDGTREYSEGRGDWAVHVALAVDGEVKLGAVALPAVGMLFRSDKPLPLPPASSVPRMAISRTRPPREATRVACELGAETLEYGSAGAKAMAVVMGLADIYLHTGGQHEWDNAAPVAVALAHGLHCSRIDGSSLVYNCADVATPDLLICRPEWAERVLKLLG